MGGKGIKEQLRNNTNDTPGGNRRNKPLSLKMHFKEQSYTIVKLWVPSTVAVFP